MHWFLKFVLEGNCTCSSVHHQEFFTVHTAIVCVIQVMLTEQGHLLLLASRQQTCMTYTIAVCTVKNSWWWTDKTVRNMWSFIPKQIWEIGASSWFVIRKVLTYIFCSQICEATKLFMLCVFICDTSPRVATFWSMIPRIPHVEKSQRILLFVLYVIISPRRQSKVTQNFIGVLKSLFKCTEITPVFANWFYWNRCCA